MRRVRKAWNGGSIEAAMEAARNRRDAMITQGATLCDECGGEGGLRESGVCQQCRGAGCILPADGLKLPILDDVGTGKQP
jgi:DnaJ-class molecular chaperone